MLVYKLLVGLHGTCLWSDACTLGTVALMLRNSCWSKQSSGRELGVRCCMCCLVLMVAGNNKTTSYLSCG